MLHLALEPNDRHGLSSLNDYQFVSQGILYLSLYPMFNGYCGEFFVINFITFVLSRFMDSLFAGNQLLI
jgi:hypothetical protein